MNALVFLYKHVLKQPLGGESTPTAHAGEPGYPSS